MAEESSYNQVMVYSLLLIDLVINISDDLLLPSSRDWMMAVSESKNQINVNNYQFVIIIIRIIAIICVIGCLILHFLEVSDKVRQIAWLEYLEENDELERNIMESSKGKSRITPLPRRIALKLVVDKYWWSLLVGLSYLVLTIILQIVQLQQYNFRRPLLEPNVIGEKLSSRTIIEKENDYNQIYDQDGEISGKLRMQLSELVVNQSSYSTKLLQSTRIGAEGPDNRRFKFRGYLESVRQHSIPQTLLLLVHKLTSTFYYISFVVVYRATPNQIMNRIFSGKSGNIRQQASTLGSTIS